MSRIDTFLWMLAGWICVALVAVCSVQLAGAMDGSTVHHLIGWVEGLVLSIPSAWTCFEIAEIDHENH